MNRQEPLATGSEVSAHFIDVMKERGQLAQITHEEDLYDHLKEPRTAYIGFDPTASSLHVGSLIPIMGLRRWQQAGHRVIALVGGGTAIVGDPSGKTDMRKMMTNETIEQNMAGLRSQLEKFLDFSTPDRGVMLNNADWLVPINYLDFLREIGPHFSVNRMLTAECFKQRLEKGLSFLEFNYMLLQSYDFLHLYREKKCTLQMGGDDQWSNMLGGMELVRRLGGENSQAYCLTFPLLTTTDGKKMGKTEKGSVWLDGTLTSPYEYFQYWRNIDDDMVKKCLLLFTELEATKVEELTRDGGAALNQAKEVLAFEATALLHGRPSAEEAQNTSKQLFTGGGSGGNEPLHTIGRSELGEGMNIMDLLAASGIVATKSEARRLIQQGGLRLNDEKVSDIGMIVSGDRIEGEEGLLIRKGKKHYYRLRFSD